MLSQFIWVLPCLLVSSSCRRRSRTEAWRSVSHDQTVSGWDSLFVDIFSFPSSLVPGSESVLDVCDSDAPRRRSLPVQRRRSRDRAFVRTRGTRGERVSRSRGGSSFSSLIPPLSSWFGNFVTSENWESFWMNEGFTVFLERKILKSLTDQAHHDLHAQIGLNDLQKSVDRFGAQHPHTCLCPRLQGIDVSAA